METSRMINVVVSALAFAIVASIIVLGIRSAKSETFRDNMGREVGTATTRGNTTTFTDRMGRETGTATRQGNTTTFTDRMGREVGTATGGKR